MLASAETTTTAPTKVTVNGTELQNGKTNALDSTDSLVADPEDTDDIKFHYHDGTLEFRLDNIASVVVVSAEGGTLTIQPDARSNGKAQLRGVTTTGDLVLKGFNDLAVTTQDVRASAIKANNITIEDCVIAANINDLFNTSVVVDASSITAKGSTKATFFGSFNSNLPYPTTCTVTAKDSAYIRTVKSGATYILTSDDEFKQSDTTADSGLTLNPPPSTNTAYATSGGFIMVSPATTTDSLTVTLYNVTMNGQLYINDTKPISIVTKDTTKIKSGASQSAVQANQAITFQGNSDSSLTINGGPPVYSSDPITFSGGSYTLCNTALSGSGNMKNVTVNANTTVTLDADGTKSTTIKGTWSVALNIDESTGTQSVNGTSWNADTKTLTLDCKYLPQLHIIVTGDVTIKIKGKVIVAGAIEVNGSDELTIIGEGSGASLDVLGLLATDRNISLESINVTVDNAFRETENGYIKLNSLKVPYGSSFTAKDIALTCTNLDDLDSVANSLPNGFQIVTLAGRFSSIGNAEGDLALYFTITGKKVSGGSHTPPIRLPSPSPPLAAAWR